eukprot:EG_transcript_3618
MLASDERRWVLADYPARAADRPPRRSPVAALALALGACGTLLLWWPAAHDGALAVWASPITLRVVPAFTTSAARFVRAYAGPPLSSTARRAQAASTEQLTEEPALTKEVPKKQAVDGEKAQMLRDAIDAALADGAVTWGPLLLVAKTNRRPAPREAPFLQGELMRLVAAVLPVVDRMATGDLLATLDTLARLAGWDPALETTLAEGEGRSLVDLLFGRLRHPTTLASLDGTQCCAVLWALGRIGLRDEPLVLALANQVGQQPLSGTDISLALWGLARVKQRVPKLLRTFGERLKNPGLELDKQSIGNIPSALAKLDWRDDAVFASLTTRLMEGNLVDILEGAELGFVAEAYAKLQIRNEPLLARLAERFIASGVLEASSIRELKNVLWAFATLRLPNARLLAAVQVELLRDGGARIAPLRGQDVARLAWSLAVLRTADMALLDRLVAHVLQPPVLRLMDGRSISMMAFATARLGLRNPPLLTALGDRLVGGRLVEGATERNVAEIAYAYATLETVHVPLMAALAARLRDQDFLRTFPCRSLTDTVWSFARLRVLDEGMADSLAQHVARPSVLKACDVRCVPMLVWALASLEVKGKEAWAALAQRVRGPDVLPRFNIRQAAKVAWAFAKAPHRDDALLAPLAALCTPQFLAGGNEQSLTNLCWAYNVLKFRHEPMLRALGDAVAQRMAAFRGQSLAAVLDAFTGLKFQHPGLVEAVSRRITSSDLVAKCGVSERAALRRAVRKLNVTDPAVLQALA